MGKPDGSIPPPSSIPPSRCPRPGRPPQGPGSPGLTPGKGLPLSKGQHPSAVPGLGLKPPIPGPRGWRWGPPQIPGGDRSKAHLLLTPRVMDPLRDQPARRGGGQLRSLLGVGDQVNSFHCLGAMGRGRPDGLLPHPSLPSLPGALFLPGSPGRHLRRGRRGRARRGGEGSPPPARKPPSPARCPLHPRKAGSRARGGSPWAGGGGLPAPPPVER